MWRPGAQAVPSLWLDADVKALGTAEPHDGGLLGKVPESPRETPATLASTCSVRSHARGWATAPVCSALARGDTASPDGGCRKAPGKWGSRKADPAPWG